MSRLALETSIYASCVGATGEVTCVSRVLLEMPSADTYTTMSVCREKEGVLYSAALRVNPRAAHGSLWKSPCLSTPREMLGSRRSTFDRPRRNSVSEALWKPLEMCACGRGRRLPEIFSSTPLRFPVALEVTSKGFLSSLNLQMLESFTFAFDGGDGFRTAPVSYSTARHRSHLSKSERELV